MFNESIQYLKINFYFVSFHFIYHFYHLSFIYLFVRISFFILNSHSLLFLNIVVSDEWWRSVTYHGSTLWVFCERFDACEEGVITTFLCFINAARARRLTWIICVAICGGILQKGVAAGGNWCSTLHLLITSHTAKSWCNSWCEPSITTSTSHYRGILLLWLHLFLKACVMHAVGLALIIVR